MGAKAYPTGKASGGLKAKAGAKMKTASKSNVRTVNPPSKKVK